MKHRAALMMAMLLLCTACQNAPAVKQEKTLSLSLAVQSDLSENAQAGVEKFVQKVSELSGGQFMIETQYVDDVLAALEEGADIVVASNEQLVRIDGSFSAFTSPFFFYNYKHLSLTLNSQSFLDLAGERLLSLVNTRPVGAFYDGNSAMVAARGLTLDTLDQYRGTKIYIGQDELLQYVLKEMGAQTVESRSLSERVQGFNAGRYAAIECDTLALGELRLPTNNEVFTVCETFHRARVNWMLFSQESLNRLSDFEQAVLTEAVAFAIAENDERVLELERKGRNLAEEAGGQVLVHNRSEFWEVTEQILRNSARYNALWDWEQYVQLRSLAMQTG